MVELFEAHHNIPNEPIMRAAANPLKAPLIAPIFAEEYVFFDSAICFVAVVA